MMTRDEAIAVLASTHQFINATNAIMSLEELSVSTDAQVLSVNKSETRHKPHFGILIGFHDNQEFYYDAISTYSLAELEQWKATHSDDDDPEEDEEDDEL